MNEKARLSANRWLLYGKCEEKLEDLNTELTRGTVNQRAVKRRRRELEELFGEAAESQVRYLSFLKLDPTTAGQEADFTTKLRSLRRTVPAEDEDFDNSPEKPDPRKGERELALFNLHNTLQAVGYQVDSLKLNADQLKADNQAVVTTYIADCDQGLVDTSQKVPGMLSSIVPLFVDDAKRTETITEIQGKLAPLVKALTELRAAAMRLLVGPGPAGPPPLSRAESLNSTVVLDTSSGSARQPTQSRHVKIAPLAPPKWDGRVRTYIEFRQLFTEAIGNHCERYTTMRYLQECIPAKLWAELDTHTSDPANVWDQLDADFGSPEMLLGACLADMDEVGRAKLGDQAKVRKLAITLTSVEAALTVAGNESELRNDLYATQLERMIPSGELVEFGKRLAQGSAPGGSRYLRIRNFLTSRKAEVEQASRLGGGRLALENNALHSVVRQDSSAALQSAQPGPGGEEEAAAGHPTQHSSAAIGDGRCFNCGQLGHLAAACPEPVRKCGDCKQEGHRAGSRLCKEPKESRKKGRGGGGDRSRSPSGRSSHATRFSPDDCYRCQHMKPADTEKCGGCRKPPGQHKQKHCLAHCPVFLAAAAIDRVKMVKDGNCCASCMARGHGSKECQSKMKRVCGLDGCQRRHHPSLHGAESDPLVRECGNVRAVRKTLGDALGPSRSQQGFHASFRAAAEQAELSQRERDQQLLELRAFVEGPEPDHTTVLMAMVHVHMIYGPGTDTTTIVVFMDTGSSCSIVLIEEAEKYGLFGRPIHISLETVNGTKDFHTKLYLVELLGTDGRRRLVEAIGMQAITRDLLAVNFNGVRSEFGPEVRSRWGEVEARPTGKVSLLLGADQLAYFGTTLEVVEHLAIATTPLSDKLYAYGRHSKLEVQETVFPEDVAAIRSLSFHHIRPATPKPTEVSSVYTTAPYCTVTPAPRPPGTVVPGPAPPPLPCHHTSPPDPEQLGVAVAPRCDDCRTCPRCPARGRLFSMQEEEGMRKIEEGIQFDPATNRFLVSYPFTRDPHCLDDNFGQVCRIAEAQEKMLHRRGMVEQANKVFAEMIELGVVRPLPQAERLAWKGPVHYVSWSLVEREDNPSSPLRFVTNSSLRGRSGLSLNDILWAGPKILNDAFNLLLTFRNHLVGMAADLKKAFWQLRCGLVESHVRRIVWRWGDRADQFTVMGE